MELFSFDYEQIFNFLLTMLRVGMILFLLPFFGGEGIPKTVKGALLIILSLVFYKVVGFKHIPFPSHPLSLIIMLISELLLGMILGMIVRIIFAAIQTGGQIIGFSMGFTMVTVMDPDSGTQMAVTSHLLYMVALVTFLTLDGHLYILSGLVQSFKLIPPGGLMLTPLLADSVLEFSATLFVLAVKIAAPVLTAVFLVDLALALVGRAAPQMNLLMLGFPLKIAVGFSFLGSMFTLISMYMSHYIESFGGIFSNILRAAS